MDVEPWLRVELLALSVGSSVTLGRSCNISQPQFPHLFNALRRVLIVHTWEQRL